MIRERNKDELGAAVRKLRRKRGWSQDYLAKLLGVTVWSVWAWEAAREHPNGRHVLALVDLGLELPT